MRDGFFGVAWGEAGFDGGHGLLGIGFVRSFSVVRVWLVLVDIN